MQIAPKIVSIYPVRDSSFSNVRTGPDIIDLHSPSQYNIQFQHQTFNSNSLPLNLICNNCQINNMTINFIESIKQIVLQEITFYNVIGKILNKIRFVRQDSHSHDFIHFPFSLCSM